MCKEGKNYERVQSYNDFLQMLLLELLVPNAFSEHNVCIDYWKSAKDYDSYMAVVICVRQALGAQRIWPGKIRLFRKAGAFVRDAWLTDQR